MSAPYMIAQPPAGFQVRGPAGPQGIPMVLVGGAAPGGQPGLIQLPQQAAANILPGMNQQIVCTNPAQQPVLPPVSYTQVSFIFNHNSPRGKMCKSHAFSEAITNGYSQ